MADFRYTERAKRNLAEIWNYTEGNWGHQQADRYIRQIEGRVALAVKRRALRLRTDLGAGLFSVSADSHVAFLEEQPGGEFLVIAILHQKMDAKTRLSEE